MMIWNKNMEAISKAIPKFIDYITEDDDRALSDCTLSKNAPDEAKIEFEIYKDNYALVKETMIS